MYNNQFEETSTAKHKSSKTQIVIQSHVKKVLLRRQPEEMGRISNLKALRLRCEKFGFEVDRAFSGYEEY